MVDNDIEYIYCVKRKGDYWTVCRKPLDKEDTMTTLEILTEDYQWRPLTCPSANRPLKDDSLDCMIFLLTGRAIETLLWD